MAHLWPVWFLPAARRTLFSGVINQFSDSTSFAKMYDFFAEGEPKYFLDKAKDLDT